MKLSLKLFGREFTVGAEKAISPDMSAWLNGEDDDTDGKGAKLTNPYTQSTWVYVAISRLAEKIASIPFRISKMDSDQAKRVRALRKSSNPRQRAEVRRDLGESIIESGAVVDLFNCPHPSMNRQLFWEMVVTWNCLKGEFFILPLDDMDQPVDLSTGSPRVARMLTVAPELFWHIVTGYELNGWRYSGSPMLTPIPSQVLTPSEVLHARTPNPFLYWRGLSPLLVALGPAQADYAASKYNQGYWINNADTGVIVTTDQQATPEQREAIIAALRERKRKAGTADRPLFLWGGAKVEKPQISGMESQMIDNRKMNRQELLAIWKVTDSFVGFTDSKTSALSGGGSAINQDEIKIIEGTITPLCEHIEAALDPIVKSFGPGLMGWFDVEGLPIMQEARRARLDAGVKAFGIGATFNDINRVYELGFPEYPGWGDKNFLPFSLQEANSAGSEELPDESNSEEKANPFARMKKLLGSVGQAPAERGHDLEKLWLKHVSARRKTVKLFESRVRRVLGEFLTSTLTNLDKVTLGEADKSAQQRSLIDLIFDPKSFGAKLFSELKQPIISALQLSGDELRKEVGLDDPWKMPPRKALEYLEQRSQPIQNCGDTVRKRLNTSLQEGLTEGETTKELTERVKTVFGNIGNADAKRIALTETNVAFNSARQDAMADSGIAYKAWLSSHGPHVRAAHAQAERDYTIDNPIPIEQPFVVGGEELMFPGDPSGSPENVINCQCIQLAAKLESEDSKTATFRVMGAGLMKFTKEAQ
jgi:phage portal protein BeeE